MAWFRKATRENTENNTKQDIDEEYDEEDIFDEEDSSDDIDDENDYRIGRSRFGKHRNIIQGNLEQAKEAQKKAMKAKMVFAIITNPWIMIPLIATIAILIIYIVMSANAALNAAYEQYMSVTGRTDNSKRNFGKRLEFFITGVQSGQFTLTDSQKLLNEDELAEMKRNGIDPGSNNGGGPDPNVPQPNTIINGDVLIPPAAGTQVSVSPGTDKPNYTVTVAAYDTWSIEYSIPGANTLYPGSTAARRLNYAAKTYALNKNSSNELLTMNVPGYSPCYCGAMVTGYANIGDIMKIELDNSDVFYFMILDVKSTSHTSSQLSAGQIQGPWGHGYDRNGACQLSVCEFISAADRPHDSAKLYSNGTFLSGRKVVKSTKVATVTIDSSYTGGWQ